MLRAGGERVWQFVFFNFFLSRLLRQLHLLAVEGPLPIRQSSSSTAASATSSARARSRATPASTCPSPPATSTTCSRAWSCRTSAAASVSAVSYDSHDPIDKTLRSFAVDLTGNPTFGQILNQARGEKVEVVRCEQEGRPAGKLTGTIVGVEAQAPAGRQGRRSSTWRCSTCPAPSGLRSVTLDEVHGVRFLNPVARERVPAGPATCWPPSHDTQKKAVSLGFAGEGKRAVRVGYVVESPIWKTSYRLGWSRNGKAFLQGWAIVENTSDEDWNDVRMVLVSGRPISFQMDLYEPLYVPRPIGRAGAVRVAAAADLRRRDGPGGPAAKQRRPACGAAAACHGCRRQRRRSTRCGCGMSGQFGGNIGSLVRQASAAASSAARRLRRQLGQGGSQRTARRILRQHRPARIRTAQLHAANTINNRLTFEELQQRRQQQDQAARSDAKEGGAAIAGLNFKEGIAVGRHGRGGRRLLPVRHRPERSRCRGRSRRCCRSSTRPSRAPKVSIFNEAIHAKYPLLGLRLKNTSGQPLTQGPITVYDSGTYAGDTRILDLQPNEERLLSYALDQGTEVKTDVKTTPSPDMTLQDRRAEPDRPLQAAPDQDLHDQEPLDARPHRHPRAPDRERLEAGRPRSRTRRRAATTASP